MEKTEITDTDRFEYIRKRYAYVINLPVEQISREKIDEKILEENNPTKGERI